MPVSTKVEWVFIYVLGAMLFVSYAFAWNAFSAEPSNPLYAERFLCLLMLVANVLTFGILLLKVQIVDRAKPDARH